MEIIGTTPQVAAALGPRDKMGDCRHSIRSYKPFYPASFDADSGKGYEKHHKAMKHMNIEDSKKVHLEYMGGGMFDPSEDYHQALMHIFFKPWHQRIAGMSFGEGDASMVPFPFFYDACAMELQVQALTEGALCLLGDYFPAFGSAKCRLVQDGYAAYLHGTNLDNHLALSTSSDGRSSRVGKNKFFTLVGMDGISGPHFYDRIKDAVKIFKNEDLPVTVRLEQWRGMKFMLENAKWNTEEEDNLHICHTSKDNGPMTLRRGKSSSGAVIALKLLSVGFGPEEPAYTFDTAIAYFKKNGNGNADLVRKAFGFAPLAPVDAPAPVKKPVVKRDRKKRKVLHANTFLSYFLIVLPTYTGRLDGGRGSRLCGGRTRSRAA